MRDYLSKGAFTRENSHRREIPRCPEGTPHIANMASIRKSTHVPMDAYHGKEMSWSY